MACLLFASCVAGALAFVVVAIIAMVRGKKRVRWLTLVVSTALLAGGVYACGVQQTASNASLKDMRPYDANDPYHRRSFYVVAFENNEARLMRLEDAKGGLTFYIPSNRMTGIKETLGATAGAASVAELQVTNNNPSARTQRVSLRVDDDDFQWFCVYDASDHGVQPVLFGDITKRKLYEGGLPGAWWFLASAVVAITLNIITIRLR